MTILRGLTLISVLVNGGAIEANLKSNNKSSCAYAGSPGFNIEGSKRFRVISACSSRWSQFLWGSWNP